MATLILTAVGGLIGGRIGGAIGAVLGQRIDGKLFGPKGGSGPRLGDLTFQSSTYGAQLPKLFGRMRVAGSVIWATDLKEDRRKVSTGKGKPKQTVYSYSASFAVALSARRAIRVGRIWADGKLLRGEAGDFKTQTGFRFHTGEEGQAPDPLISAAEGAGQTPAYRGLAYAVFEDFQLTDYGNRIPSLSFEVIADEGAVSIGMIVAGLAPSITAEAPTQIDGMAVSGDSLRGVFGTLADLITLSASDSGTGLLIKEAALPAPPLQTDDLGASVNGNVSRLTLERASPASIPHKMSLAYYDVSRDYQQGSQSVSRPGSALREVRSEFAAALSPAKAKSLISQRLIRELAGREVARVTLPWRYAGLVPGQSLLLPGTAGTWLIRESSLEGMVVHLTLNRSASPAQVALGADAGRGVYESDLIIGPTLLALLDLPWLGAGLATAPSVYAVAAGTGSGWRSAALLQSNDGGVSVEEVGSTAPSAIIGTASTILASGTSSIIDRANSVDVTLAHSGMTLVDADFAGLIAGRNLASLGAELIQFERVEALGGANYRLAGLLRGRRGTEAAMATHQIGECFVLVENDALAPLTVPLGLSSMLIWASGVGDLVPVHAVLAAPGIALRPLSPSHLKVEEAADTIVRWIRRSRDGWRWDDFVDAPLGEEAERYRLTITPNIGAVRTINVIQPHWTYAASERSADVSGGASSVTIAVQQSGTYGPSLASVFTLSLT
jgi:Putative phage tail protein